jgi:hypothetical protein
MVMEATMVSYEHDILILMQDPEECMENMGWLLSDVEFMTDPVGGQGFDDHFHARKTYARLSTTNLARKMPKGGPYWTDDQLALYRQWMEEGFQP